MVISLTAFLPDNVSRLALPKFAWTHNFSKSWNHIHFARHLTFFCHGVGDSMKLFFLKSVTYLPPQHLANSGEAQLKNHPVSSRIGTSSTAFNSNYILLSGPLANINTCVTCFDLYFGKGNGKLFLKALFPESTYFFHTSLVVWLLPDS